MKRIQRKRVKGWKMPPKTVYVGRPTKWGNPFILKDAYSEAAHDLSSMKIKYTDPKNEGARDWSGYATELAIINYKRYLSGHPEIVAAAKIELKGKDLACWCKIGEPCHADVLIEVIGNIHEQKK